MDTATWQFIGVLVAIGSNLITTVYFLARLQAKVEALTDRIDRLEADLKQDIRDLRKDLNDVIRRIDKSSYVPGS
jgi:cell division protein FtsB